jgi:hypothetical protein
MRRVWDRKQEANPLCLKEVGKQKDACSFSFRFSSVIDPEGADKFTMASED